MRRTVIAICFVGLMAGNGVAATIDRWIEGETAKCTCDARDPEEIHRSWRYPQLSFHSASVTSSVNRRIARDVLNSLKLPSFPTHHHECGCDDRSAFVFHWDNFCEATHVSDRYVTLLCSKEGYSGGKGGTSYRTILIRISGNRSTPLKPSDLFRNNAAVEAVQKILAKKIADDYKATLKGPNANIDEADIPQLAEKMFDSVVFADGGMRFLVLGGHHSAFEALLTVNDVREYVTSDVLRELIDSDARRRKGQP
jgi:hypothetical protein